MIAITKLKHSYYKVKAMLLRRVCFSMPLTGARYVSQNSSFTVLPK